MPDDIMAEARFQFEQSLDASNLNRQEAIADIEFSRLSIQWAPEVARIRQLEGRPCLTINRLKPLIRQVVNDARQNKPGIAVHPVDGGADYDTAEVVAGLLRAIERNSNAGVAYDTAIDNAVTGGFGFFRIEVDYAHSETFDMEARIERIGNPLSVYWDANSTTVDASDWNYAFVSDYFTEAEFKKKWPKASMTSFDGGWGDDDANWVDEDRVRVAEYWRRDCVKRRLLGFADGSAMPEAQVEKAARRYFEAMGYAPEVVKAFPNDALLRDFFERTGMAPTRERMADHHTVKRRMISGVEVLEEADWPGSMIPICPVWGEEVFFNGRRHFQGLIRDARDPQAMLNFWRSASTELVALAPRAPWIAPVGSIPSEGEEAEKWATANTRSHAYLLYEPSAGPAPQRQPFAGVPAGALQEALNASDDIKSVTGIYDAALGNRSNETSGRAIMARQRESDNSTFHFIDNLSRAIQYAGRCLVEIVGSVYSERQAIQILGVDMAPKVVRLTAEDGGQTNVEGQPRLYNLSVGRYDVTVKAGPSYTTQREEARDALLEIMRAVPQSAMVLGDLALKNMDFPDADEAAKRINLLQQMEMQKMGMAPPGPPPAGAPQMPSQQQAAV